MLPSGSAIPMAGSTRPNTVSGGSWTTYRHNVVSTITFSSTFVNKPKNPFQSPGTHQRTAPCPFVMSSPCLFVVRRCSRSRQRLQETRGIADPAENAALCLDHLQRRGLELREIRSDAILEHEAVVAAVVRLANRCVD